MRAWLDAARSGAQRWLPVTLRGRLMLMLFVAVIASHVLTLAVVFELAPYSWSGDPPPVDAWPDVPDDIWYSPATLLDIGVRLLALLLPAWLGARWLSEPLQRLAQAARELGTDIHRPPLAETDGTLECREASRVFNQMQACIRQQMADRDRFVAAVSHDLRTPLTRLRLRAENLPGEDRLRFSRDIEEMDVMLTATLDHLRGVARAEPMVQLDIQALLESLVDDEHACGHDVRLSGRAAPIAAQATALRRCIGNLVGNAVRYGEAAHITVSDTGDAVSIRVRDFGPGLPPAELDKVLKPFYRGPGASRHAKGLGLGLSIVQDIVQRHRGHLQLDNAPDGGLIALVSLPRLEPPAQPG